MADREKVVKGLKTCTERSVCCGCGYYKPYAPRTLNSPPCYKIMMKDALELLEKQEPKHGRWERLTGMAPPEYHGHKVCSVCGCLAPYDPIHPWREELSKYCPGCGAEMEGEVE